MNFMYLIVYATFYSYNIKSIKIKKLFEMQSYSLLDSLNSSSSDSSSDSSNFSSSLREFILFFFFLHICILYFLSTLTRESNDITDKHVQHSSSSGILLP